MILTIFRSRLRPDAREYSHVAHEMLELAQQMPGFVSFKTFKHDDGERCSVVLFADWDSHHAWAKHPRHIEAQRQGRADFYSEYSIVVAEVARSYGFGNREEKPVSFNEGHLRKLYDDFNAQNIESILPALAPDVRWANGVEGGFVHGRDDVRAYWRKQFQTVRPQLRVLDLREDERGRALFTVHQTVRDLNGNVLLEHDVKHRFTLQNDLIALFEIVGQVEVEGES